MTENKFTSFPPTVMHIDLNSCFATIEQQANPALRGKPVAVAAYTTPNGCILAASYEAKRMGVATGMRVRDGRALCPALIILPSDPEKYRFVNHALHRLFLQYTPNLAVESIDEMVLSLADTPALKRQLLSLRGDPSFSLGTDSVIPKSSFFVIPAPARRRGRKAGISSDLRAIDPRLREDDDLQGVIKAMISIGFEIKKRIKTEIGEWLTVSIGIAPNRYLAKVASGLHKPDGMDAITGGNIEEVLSGMVLEDLCGIKDGYGRRLRYAGILTPLDFYRADSELLMRAFHSVVGYYWWLRLHGREDGSMYKQFKEDPSTSSGLIEEEQKTIGHSHALGKPYEPTDPRLHQILTQLVVKMGKRLRDGGFTAGGVHVSCLFTDHTYWHHGQKLVNHLFSDGDLYQAALRVLSGSPQRLVRILAVNTYSLIHDLYRQGSLFEEDERKKKLSQALDAIHDRWGDFVVTPARMLGMEHRVVDRIAFGKV